MTREQLAAALRAHGWERVEVLTFREWLAGDPELLAAQVGDPDQMLCVRVTKGPASAVANLTTDLLETGRFDVAGFFHERLRRAWADAVWAAPSE